MLQAIAFWVMILSGSGLVALFVNSMWKRYIRLKALEPGLDREWVADCAKHGSATFKGSKVSLKNVRDFSWKNKREHEAARESLKIHRGSKQDASKQADGSYKAESRKTNRGRGGRLRR